MTSGLSVQRHSMAVENWDALGGMGRWGAGIPTLDKSGLTYRSGLGIGQVIQTPQDLTRSDLIVDDVPYAGALTMQSSWYAYNDKEFRGFEVTVGVVGPPSLAEQTQKTLHKIIGSEEPMGWDNQLNTEPVLNATYMRKWKFWRMGNPEGGSFDAVVNVDAELGNMITKAGTALELRWGHNLPGGFLSLPDPIGIGMHYKAAFKPARAEKGSFYATLVFRGHAFGHNIFLDGNTFSDSHSVDKEPLVGQVIGGLHYECGRWGIHYCMMMSTNDVDPHYAPAATAGEKLGSIVFEWRF